MPSKNIIKQYLENSYYHIYNRGVEKRNIFNDAQDYKVFLSYIKDYLTPINKEQLRKELARGSYKERDKIIKRMAMNNYTKEIDLLAYCLLPNHFHLLVKQHIERGINNFIRSLATRYVMYFNKRNKRVGGLFQSRYKAVFVNTDEQLLYLTHYIHINPSSLSPYKGPSLLEYPYSSLGSYLGKWSTDWLKPKEVLAYFSSTNSQNSYENFIFGQGMEDRSDELITNLIIE